jgi:catechol 2,3-dioxygenase-like lactoylglutathione lyase family enzyme
MGVVDLHHFTIRSLDVDATVAFYTGVLGMTVAPRPLMSMPGAWLNMGTTQVHILGGDAALDAKGQYTPGGGAMDHVGLNAVGYDELRQKVVDSGADYRQADLRDAGMWQLFVKDPSGVVVELNFQVAQEPEGSSGPTEEFPHSVGKF